MSALQLIAGLGNPGSRYADTRHNSGANFVFALAQQFGASLKVESKFQGLVGRCGFFGEDVRLLVPTTYMNLSGEAVQAITHFYKIPPENVLIAYDEVAFEPGIVKLKTGGGHNGHNGIRDIMRTIGADFHRLRIGVGHPGDKNRVTSYLTQSKIPEKERVQIEDAYNFTDEVIKLIVKGEWQAAMNKLHMREVQ